MADDERILKKVRAKGVIGVVVGVDDRAHRTAETLFQKGLDLPGFFRVGQGIDQNGSGGGHNSPSGDLCIQLAGEHINVIGNTFTLHGSRRSLWLRNSYHWQGECPPVGRV